MSSSDTQRSRASHGDARWSRRDVRRDVHADPAKARKVRAMFGAIAGRYDLNNRLHSFGRDVAWRRAAVRMAQLVGGERVLDMACGTGDLTRCFASAASAPSEVVGGDFTPEMLDIARAKRVDSGAAPVSYTKADAMALPFSAGSFDVVSIAFGIRNVTDPLVALGEFARVLRPGGRLIVLEFARPVFAPVAWGNDFYTGVVMPRTAGLVARFGTRGRHSDDGPNAYRYLHTSIGAFAGGTDAGMRTMLASAGFSDILSRGMTFGVCRCYRALLAE